MSPTPKPTPEAEESPDKTEPVVEGKELLRASVKSEQNDLEKRLGPSVDRNASEAPALDSSNGPRKDDAEEEKSSAAAAKERQMERAETIRLAPGVIWEV